MGERSLLATLTPVAAEALRAGHIVLLPYAVIDDAPAHRFGPTAGLERHFHAQAVGGPVCVVPVPIIDRVAVFTPNGLDRSGHDASTVLGELTRINTLMRRAGAEDLLDRVQPRGPIETLAFQECVA